MRSLSILPLLLLLGVTACGERRPQEPPKTVDSALLPQEVPVVRGKEYNPANKENFERVVYMEFAHAGTNVPRRVVDSITNAAIRSTGNPAKAEEAMNAYMHHHDSLARAALAAKYDISVDSLNRIITRMSRDTTKQ